MTRSTSQLHLALLGAPEAHLGKRALKFPTRKTLALLAYLAAEAGEQQREHLAACCGRTPAPNAATPHSATRWAICNPPCAGPAAGRQTALHRGDLWRAGA